MSRAQAGGESILLSEIKNLEVVVGVILPHPGDERSDPVIVDGPTDFIPSGKIRFDQAPICNQDSEKVLQWLSLLLT